MSTTTTTTTTACSWRQAQMIRGPWISVHQFQYCLEFWGWVFHSSTCTLLGSNSIMSGCKSRGKAVPHNLHDADVVQDSSPEERFAGSMGNRSTWIPACSTTNASTLNTFANTLRTSYVSKWSYGVWAWRRALGRLRRCMARYGKALAHFHSNRQSITCTM